MNENQINCSNCEAILEHSFHFCSQCGQKVNERITFRLLFHSLVNSIFSFDSTLFTTLPPFLVKPGRVPSEFIKGKRKKFVPPISMYVFLSFIFFLVFSAFFVKKWDKKLTDYFANISNEQMTNVDSLRKLEAGSLFFEISELPTDSLTIDSLNNEMKNSAFAKKDSLIKAGFSNEEIIEELNKDGEENNSFLEKVFQHTELNFLRNKGKGSIALFFSQLSIVIIVNIIFFGLLSKLLYIRRSFNLPEHFVHTLYYFNFLLLLAIFCSLCYLAFPVNYWFFVFYILAIFYLFFSMKEFYKQSYLKTALKAFLLTFGFFPFVLGVSLFIMAFLTIYQYGQ